MTQFARFMSKIADARTERDRHADVFARIMQDRIALNDQAITGDSTDDLLAFATRAIARQAAHDFVAMNQPVNPGPDALNPDAAGAETKE